MKKVNLVTFILLIPFILVTTTCQRESTLELVEPVHDDPIFVDFPVKTNSSSLKSATKYQAVLYKGVFLTTREKGGMGRTVYFTERGNRQFAEDFVPLLSSLTDGTTDITYYIDEDRPSKDVPVDVSSAAIQRAMTSWDDIHCSNLEMAQIPFDGRPTGLLAYELGYGGSNEIPDFDILHCGWLPIEFWASILPGITDHVIAMVFTYYWIDENGEFTDVDNNKKYDVAWNEIYYNDFYPWSDGQIYPIDIETVALHETGHALCQTHSGAEFITRKNGKLHYSPKAVMLPFYRGIETDLYPTDMAGHCSIWANWPQK